MGGGEARHCSLSHSVLCFSWAILLCAVSIGMGERKVFCLLKINVIPI